MRHHDASVDDEYVDLVYNLPAHIVVYDCRPSQQVVDAFPREVGVECLMKKVAKGTADTTEKVRRVFAQLNFEFNQTNDT